MNYETCLFQIDSKEVKGLKIIGNKIDQRNAAHTIILLDTSGSMEDDNKLNNVKRSLQYLLQFLLPSDFVSLITFCDSSKIIIENVSVNSDTSHALNFAISNLVALGGTNLSAGLLNVCGVLERSHNQNIKTGLIILTDGHTNEGITRNSDLITIIDRLKNICNTITINSVGYGNDHNSTLLKDIAIHGNGGYSIVNNLESVATVFGEILGGIMSCVAQNTYVTTPKSWVCYNMYSKKEDTNSITIDIGDIYAETETILLFNSVDGNASLHGISVKNFQNIQYDINWSNNTNNSEPYMLAYIRNKLAHLLQNISKQRNTSAVIANIKVLLQPFERSNNIIVPFLKEQLQLVENSTENSNHLNANQLLQTSAFLGLGRGISTNMSPIRRQPSSYDDIDNVINLTSNLNIYSPFSNRIQRDLTYSLNATLSQDPS